MIRPYNIWWLLPYPPSCLHFPRKFESLNPSKVFSDPRFWVLSYDWPPPFILLKIKWSPPQILRPPWKRIETSSNQTRPSSKNSHFKNEAKGTTFLAKMSFICMRMKNHFHIKGWTLNLVLTQRAGGTRKWPIAYTTLLNHYLHNSLQNSSNSCLV